MKKKMRIPRNKGYIWIKGMINGKTRTASLDANGVVQSGFIQRVCNEYAAYSAKRMADLDKTMHEHIAKSEKILLEIRVRTQKSKVQELMKPVQGVTKTEQQIYRQRQEKHNSEQSASFSNYKKSIEELIELVSQMRVLEEQYQLDMEETARRVEAVFATYSKGVLFCSCVTEQTVPKVEVNTRAVQLYRGWNLGEDVLTLIQEVVESEKE